MKDNAIDQIIHNLKNAQEIAKEKLKVDNLLQPGMIKEIIMAKILNHKIIPTKREPDAIDFNGDYYEYLSSIVRDTKNNKGSSFQIDRITPNNLKRITRNKCFYFGFFKDNLNVLEIWKVETCEVLEEVNRQLKSCKNRMAHVNFLTNWVCEVGTKVYPQDSSLLL